MENETSSWIFILVPVFLTLALIARLIAGMMDGKRINSYVRRRGWELLDWGWDPFGPGWFSEKNARIYQVAYRDELGNSHKAYAKTSLLAGVYFTDDRIVKNAATTLGNPDSDEMIASDELEPLRHENQALKKQLAENSDLRPQ